MIEIDGSQYSGSGTIVRQAVAFSALTGQPVHIVNARFRRPKPGLRHQHIRVVQAIGELVSGTAEGLISRVAGDHLSARNAHDRQTLLLGHRHCRIDTRCWGSVFSRCWPLLRRQ